MDSRTLLIPKEIEAIIGRETWPNHTSIPTTFPVGSEVFRFDFGAVLGLIGVLTTPPTSGGASLSEMWAFVRYLLACTDDSDLRLKREFLDLDAHQKTILSDDFGVGFGIYWLVQKLDLRQACDGRYFVENFLDEIGGTYEGGAAKRGPGKSPDFVCTDGSGKFHIIECKGTQSSRDYRNRQLQDSGRMQKATIKLPRRCRGQSLAIGTFIAGPEGEGSQLKVIDPEPENPLKVRKRDMSYAIRTMERGMLSKELRAAGFPNAAAALAFPTRRRDIEQRSVFTEKSETFEQRQETGRSELNSIKDKTFNFKKEQYVGSKIVLPLSKPLLRDGKGYTAVEVRRGVSRNRFDQVRKLENFADVDFERVSHKMPIQFLHEGAGASVEFGNGFVSSIKLLAY